jgi:hypothetical protein
MQELAGQLTPKTDADRVLELEKLNEKLREELEAERKIARSSSKKADLRPEEYRRRTLAKKLSRRTLREDGSVLEVIKSRGFIAGTLLSAKTGFLGADAEMNITESEAAAFPMLNPKNKNQYMYKW